MSDAPSSLTGREIIVAVCGGIAAYKVADLVSKLVQAGAGVTVCMTADAEKFVTPLTFESLSRRKVRTDTFDLVDSSDTQHIGLTERADLMLVAPSTANLIAKVAHGLCDDLVSLMINAAACPVVFAPSMNDRMWANPITKQNVAKLQKLGYAFIGPEEGWLACRNVGAGRLSEPTDIVEEIVRLLSNPRPPFPPLPPGEGRGEGDFQKSPPSKPHRKPPVRDDLLVHSREMRHNPTDAEQALWRLLRGRRLGGFKFRRQHPVDGYIIDFYSPEARLGVELDGGQHADPPQRERDERRTSQLTKRGVRLLRFWDDEVLRDRELVAERILEAAEANAHSHRPHPFPLPEGEGEMPQ